MVSALGVGRGLSDFFHCFLALLRSLVHLFVEIYSLDPLVVQQVAVSRLFDVTSYVIKTRSRRLLVDSSSSDSLVLSLNSIQ